MMCSPISIAIFAWLLLPQILFMLILWRHLMYIKINSSRLMVCLNLTLKTIWLRIIVRRCASFKHSLFKVSSLVVRDLMGRDKDLRSLKDLRKRFEFVLTKPEQRMSRILLRLIIIIIIILIILIIKTTMVTTIVVIIREITRHEHHIFPLRPQRLLLLLVPIHLTQMWLLQII